MIEHNWLCEGICSDTAYLRERRFAFPPGRSVDWWPHGFNPRSEVAPFPEVLRRNAQSCCACLRVLEEEIQYQAHSIHLLIRALARVVLVLVIGIELDVLGHGQKATRIEISGADFCVLALVE